VFLEEILEVITLVALACVLAVFVSRLATSGRRKEGRVLDFGTAFSIFIAGWVTAELLALTLPKEWSAASDALHLAVALGFAIWIIVRWRWALRLARGSP
jgi:hypothetical protein